MSNTNCYEGTLMNCSIQGNSADHIGALYIFNGNNAPLNLVNCVIWNNASAGSTSTLDASIGLFGSNISYDNNLIENFNPGGTNLNGNLAANDPLFLYPVDPLGNATSFGDLRLTPGSPLLDAGLDGANTTGSDLAGNDRVENTNIDIGAFEGQTKPADLWETDHDGDGLLWSVEHALGTNPDSPNPSPIEGPSFNGSGHAGIYVPCNPLAPPGTKWTLTRSTDLGDFNDEIWEFDGTGTMSGTDISDLPHLDGYMITDENPPAPKAFYRFEASYTSP